MHSVRNITAVILAGGKTCRMGGIDKGLVKCNGQALIKPIIAALAPYVDQLIINANRNIEVYQKLGYPVVSDADNSFPGPLAGFLAAMKVADTKELFIVPCDGPLLKGKLMERLITVLDINNVAEIGQFIILYLDEFEQTEIKHINYN